MKRFIIACIAVMGIGTNGLAFAQSWTAQQHFNMAKEGEISSGMWSRGEIDKKFKVKCGWSNADATYRVTNLGMKLENLADAANKNMGDGIILSRANVLLKEINKSSMYQTCFNNMVNFDLRKPLSVFDPPEHPYGQPTNPNGPVQ